MIDRVWIMVYENAYDVGRLRFKREEIPVGTPYELMEQQRESGAMLIPASIRNAIQREPEARYWPAFSKREVIYNLGEALDGLSEPDVPMGSPAYNGYPRNVWNTLSAIPWVTVTRLATAGTRVAYLVEETVLKGGVDAESKQADHENEQSDCPHCEAEDATVVFAKRRLFRTKEEVVAFVEQGLPPTGEEKKKKKGAAA